MSAAEVTSRVAIPMSRRHVLHVDIVNHDRCQHDAPCFKYTSSFQITKNKERKIKPRLKCLRPNLPTGGLPLLADLRGKWPKTPGRRGNIHAKVTRSLALRVSMSEHDVIRGAKEHAFRAEHFLASFTSECRFTPTTALVMACPSAFHG